MPEIARALGVHRVRRWFRRLNYYVRRRAETFMADKPSGGPEDFRTIVMKLENEVDYLMNRVETVENNIVENYVPISEVVKLNIQHKQEVREIKTEYKTKLAELSQKEDTDQPKRDDTISFDKHWDVVKNLQSEICYLDRALDSKEKKIKKLKRKIARTKRKKTRETPNVFEETNDAHSAIGDEHDERSEAERFSNFMTTSIAQRQTLTRNIFGHLRTLKEQLGNSPRTGDAEETRRRRNRHR